MRKKSAFSTTCRRLRSRTLLWLSDALPVRSNHDEVRSKWKIFEPQPSRSKTVVKTVKFSIFENVFRFWLAKKLRMKNWKIIWARWRFERCFFFRRRKTLPRSIFMLEKSDLSKATKFGKFCLLYANNSLITLQLRTALGIEKSLKRLKIEKQSCRLTPWLGFSKISLFPRFESASFNRSQFRNDAISIN